MWNFVYFLYNLSYTIFERIMSGKQSQPDMMSDEWFRQVNGLLGAVEVVEHPAQNPTQNLQNGITFSFR